MGGAIGGVLFAGGSILSTAAALLGKDEAENDYYQSMAATAEENARQIEQTARRNAQYIFEDAAYQNSQLMRDYSALEGRQKTALAASGLTSSSATAQMILKNSRLNALLDQEMLNDNLERAVYENNTSSSLQALQYRNQAQQYRQANSLRTRWWSQMGSALGGLFSSKNGY